MISYNHALKHSCWMFLQLLVFNSYLPNNAVHYSVFDQISKHHIQYTSNINLHMSTSSTVVDWVRLKKIAIVIYYDNILSMCLSFVSNKVSRTSEIHKMATV